MRARIPSLCWIDDQRLHMVRDNNKCILCRRCVAACEDQFVGVIGPNEPRLRYPYRLRL